MQPTPHGFKRIPKTEFVNDVGTQNVRVLFGGKT
jgi:hypothetical protein